MLIDARSVPAGTTLETDICIVGSGPAGIAIAQEFVGLPVRVLVLEAGGPEFSPSNRNDPYPPRLGGNANYWPVQTDYTTKGIRLLPLSEADTESRWFTASGWPLKAGSLDSYLPRAQQLFGLPPFDFDMARWEEPWARQLPLSKERIATGIFKFGDGKVFTEQHIAALKRCANVTLCHHATAIELLSNPEATRVQHVRIATSPGRELLVEADHFVLAGGGISAAQLLLSSGRAQPCGLGNGFDIVGRYFMDHPQIYGGDFVPASSKLFDAMALYDLRTVSDTPIMGHLRIADEALRSKPLLNLSMIFFPREPKYKARQQLSHRQQQGFDAAMRVRGACRCQHLPAAYDLYRLVMGADGAAKRFIDSFRHKNANLSQGGWSKAVKRVKYDHFEVMQQVEEAPHPDNRLVLGPGRDIFGRREIRLDWRWHDEDQAATMRSQDLFAHELTRSGAGTFRIARDDGQPVLLAGSTGHYMGATRMSREPRQGVVDEHCKVHGLHNLFVASGSVFPTGGFANPTLTIVALSLRLADRLKKVLGVQDAAPVPGFPEGATP